MKDLGVLADPFDVVTKGYVDGRTPYPAYATTHAKPYDPALNLYNGVAANLFYLRRLIGLTKQGGTGKITCIGDSTTVGTGATPATSFPMQWRNMLIASGCALRGTGIVYAGQTVSDPRFTSTGTVAVGSGIYAQLSVGATKTFVSDVPGTEIDIYYWNTSTGQVAWDIDNGATSGTIAPTGATTIGKATIGTGLADTTHTVKITASGGTVFWIGVNVRHTTGLQITNAGVATTSTANWTATTGVNPFPQAMAETPDLIVVLIGVNDSSGAVPIATYEANLTAIVTACQAIAPTLLLLPVNSSSVAAAAHNPYANAVYNVADALNVAVVDFFDRWNSYFRANTYGLIADTVHPNAAGYADWADNLFQLGDASTTQDAGTALATAGALVRRDTSGRAAFADPVAAAQAATKGYVDAVPGIRAVTTVTGTRTALANTFHLVNLAASLGATPITLPAAPPQGTVCEFIRADTNQITSPSSIVPGGTDTILGSSPYVLGGSQTGAKFIYVGTQWVVHEASIGGNMSGFYAQRSSAQAGFNPSIMARDSAGRSQVVDPAVAADIATKNYVDRYAGALKYGVD